MKVILCGKNDAAVGCLEHLTERGDRVWAIGVHGDDGTNGWQRSLQKAARHRDVRFDQPQAINGPQFLERLARYSADLLVSVQYDQVLRRRLFEVVRCPCLNVHFSLLPRHRGVAPIAWAILEGDSQTGVTLHHMVPQIDAGDVIAQRVVPIAADDSSRRVYDNLSAAAIELFRECYPFSRELLATRIPQDPACASYHRAGEFDFSQNHIEWTRPARHLHRWIRSMIFPPFQYPRFVCHGQRVDVTRVGPDVLPSSQEPPGTVVAVSEKGLDVAAAGGVIRILDVIDDTAPASSSRNAWRKFSKGDCLAPPVPDRGTEP